ARVLGERSDGGFDIIAGIAMDYLRDSQSKSRCDAFDFAPYGGKSKKGGVQNACYPPQAGADLRQQLQPFAADFRFERGKASDVSAGMRKTLNQTGTYRVDNDYEYDWDAASYPLQRGRCQCAVGHDHVRRQGHELRGVSARAIRVSDAPAIVDPNIASLCPTQPLKVLPKSCDAGLSFRIALGICDQHTDPSYLLRLLRARLHWPRSRRAANQRDELAALHSITSSASCWRWSGTSRPSALAVLRLITSSNVVGCITGRAPGLAPLRIVAV